MLMLISQPDQGTLTPLSFTELVHISFLCLYPKKKSNSYIANKKYFPAKRAQGKGSQNNRITIGNT